MQAPRQHLVAAILCGGLGLFLVLAIWMRPEALRVPPAIGYLAASTFLAASATLLLQLRGARRAALATTFLLVLALAGVGAWIGFGPGERQCDATFGALSFLPSELVCRGIFGGGGVLSALIAGLVLRDLFNSFRPGATPVE